MPALEPCEAFLEVFGGQVFGMPIMRETADIQVLKTVVVGALRTFADETDVLGAWDSVDLALFLHDDEQEDNRRRVVGLTESMPPLL